MTAKQHYSIISSRIKDGSLVLVDKEIIGNLNFSRDEEK